MRDAILRLNFSMENCRGQCYDGAANMSGARKGVASQLLSQESRAIYTHCYGHALNLAVANTIKQSVVCRDSLDVAFEITRLIKFSPKRSAALDAIKAVHQDASDSAPSAAGIRLFCSTRWTVRGDAIASIIDNYESLNELWDSCLHGSERLDPDMKARIIGVQAQMTSFNLLFGLKLCETVLKITDNLSRALQKSSLSASEGQHIASLTTATLSGLRTDTSFELFFASVETLRAKLGVDAAVLPRKRKRPQRYDDGDGHHYAASVEDHFRQLYFEAIDFAVSTIKDCFDQPGHVVYRRLETVLVNGAAGVPYDSELQPVLQLYTELSECNLKTQLTNLETHFREADVKPDLRDCQELLNHA